MILPLFRRPRSHHCGPLWRDRGAGARCRVSTRPTAVPDTVLGRFDLIVLHLALRVAAAARRARRRARAGAGRVRRVLPRHGPQSARDGHQRSGRAATDAPRRRSVLRPRPGLRCGARRAGRRRAGRRRWSATSTREAAEPQVAAERLAAYVRQAVRRSGRRRRSTALARGIVRFPGACDAAAAAE